MTYTVSNLTPNTSYRVDTLASVLGYNDNRSYTVSYNGGLVSGTLVPASSTYLYAFKDIVNSTGAGEIVVTYQNLTGDGPTVSGLVVSAVPEPSTCAMALAGLACGGYSLWRRRKRLVVTTAIRVTVIAASLAAGGSTFAEPVFIGDFDGNTITAVGTNTLNYAPASALLDGSGMIDLTAGRVTMNSKAYQQSWVTGWLADYGGVYGNNGSILFTFDRNTSLEAMVIWNLSIDANPTAYGRGVQLASISYSTGTDTSGVGSIIFDGTLAEAVWSGSYTGTGYQNNINGLTAQNVKAVKMAYTASYNPGGDYIGLSEVRFVGTAVPEPSTCASLFAGLACGGYSLFRRRRAR
jgi:hypothetical protein